MLLRKLGYSGWRHGRCCSPSLTGEATKKHAGWTPEFFIKGGHTVNLWNSNKRSQMKYQTRPGSSIRASFYGENFDQKIDVHSLPSDLSGEIKEEWEKLKASSLLPGSKAS